MRALTGLLSNSIDTVRYEDNCRGILGTSSYLLFTIDKQIMKLVKQVSSLLSIGPLGTAQLGEEKWSRKSIGTNWNGKMN